MKVISRSEAISKGMVRYFTGKPCRKRGHVSERWTCNARCVSCHDESFVRTKKTVTKEEKIKKQKERYARWYEKNKKNVIAKAKEWKTKNKEKLRHFESKWRKKPKSKAIIFMRDCLRRLIKSKNGSRTEEILGYTKEELVNSIQSKFEDGMTWDNHGEWHIDHIVSISKMVESGVSDPKIVNALSNLQPLWAIDNLRKNNK